MYVTDFICTYKMHESEYQEIMYRIQFLQAFGLEEWNDEHVADNMEQLYNALKEKEDLKEIIVTAKKSKHLEMIMAMTEGNDSTVFKLLFKYELFDATHKCLCELITTNKITSINKTQLSQLLIR